jgi:hypothetical protein
MEEKFLLPTQRNQNPRLFVPLNRNKFPPQIWIGFLPQKGEYFDCQTRAELFVDRIDYQLITSDGECAAEYYHCLPQKFTLFDVVVLIPNIAMQPRDDLVLQFFRGSQVELEIDVTSFTGIILFGSTFY